MPKLEKTLIKDQKRTHTQLQSFSASCTRINCMQIYIFRKGSSYTSTKTQPAFPHSPGSCNWKTSFGNWFSFVGSGTALRLSYWGLCHCALNYTNTKAPKKQPPAHLLCGFGSVQYVLLTHAHHLSLATLSHQERLLWFPHVLLVLPCAVCWKSNWWAAPNQTASAHCNKHQSSQRKKSDTSGQFYINTYWLSLQICPAFNPPSAGSCRNAPIISPCISTSDIADLPIYRCFSP